jgi:hypothetical protein
MRSVMDVAIGARIFSDSFARPSIHSRSGLKSVSMSYDVTS